MKDIKSELFNCGELRVFQVVLKWAMCDQQVVIPRSHDRKRIESNLKALECGLTSSDLDEISRLDGTYQDAA